MGTELVKPETAADSDNPTDCTDDVGCIACGVKILIRNPRALNDQMQESWSVGLTQVFVDAAGDVGQHLLPRQGMFLAARLPEEIQPGRVFDHTRQAGETLITKTDES